MEMQITANSTTSTNNDLIKGKSTITDIGKENDQKKIFLGPLLNTGWFLGRDIKENPKFHREFVDKGTIHKWRHPLRGEGDLPKGDVCS